MLGSKAQRLVLQAANYAVFMVIVWYFSFSPPYRQLAADEAVVTLAFGHTARRVSECVRLSQAELQKLAPNMRKPADCPRERSPVTIEVRLDGKVFAQAVIRAPGLYQDQGIDVYREIKAEQGAHRLAVWMNDDVNVDGPTYQLDQTIILHPAQRVVVSFAKGQGFNIQ